MELIPITNLNIDWSVLAKVQKSTIGQYPLNPEGKTEDQLWLNSLEVVFEKEIFQHSYYGFVILATKEFFFRLLQYQTIININITQSIKADIYVGIMTGTLLQYMSLIPYCSTGNEYQEIREMANKLQKEFESKGIRLSYSKQKIPNDYTYKLVNLNG